MICIQNIINVFILIEFDIKLSTNETNRSRIE